MEGRSDRPSNSKPSSSEEEAAKDEEEDASVSAAAEAAVRLRLLQEEVLDEEEEEAEDDRAASPSSSIVVVMCYSIVVLYIVVEWRFGERERWGGHGENDAKIDLGPSSSQLTIMAFGSVRLPDGRWGHPSVGTHRASAYRKL